MTLDEDAASAQLLTPRLDNRVADILETPRGRREWQEYKQSTERVHLTDRLAQLEERCKSLEAERGSSAAANEAAKEALINDVSAQHIMILTDLKAL